MKKNIVLLSIATIFLTVFFIFASEGSGSEPVQQFQYLSPRPGANLVAPETTIAVRLNENIDIDLSSDFSEVIEVNVDGSLKRLYSGAVFWAGDGETIIFEPDQPFAYDELVTVTINVKEGAQDFSYQYSFTIAPTPPLVEDFERWPDLKPQVPDLPVVRESADPLPLYRTVPYDFPNLDVYSAPGTGDGYVFLSHFNYSNSANGKAYLLMLGEEGEPVYYKRLHPLLAAFDFKKQPNGLLTYFDAAQKIFLAMDDQYNIVGSYQAGNGYETDLHDMQVIGDDYALVMIYDYKIIDMSLIVPGAIRRRWWWAVSFRRLIVRVMSSSSGEVGIIFQLLTRTRI